MAALVWQLRSGDSVTLLLKHRHGPFTRLQQFCPPSSCYYPYGNTGSRSRRVLWFDYAIAKPNTHAIATAHWMQTTPPTINASDVQGDIHTTPIMQTTVQQPNQFWIPAKNSGRGSRRGPRFLCSALIWRGIGQEEVVAALLEYAPAVSRYDSCPLRLLSRTREAPPFLYGLTPITPAPSRKKTEPPDFDLFGSLQTHCSWTSPSPWPPRPGMKSEPDRGT